MSFVLASALLIALGTLLISAGLQFIRFIYHFESNKKIERIKNQNAKQLELYYRQMQQRQRKLGTNSFDGSSMSSQGL